VSRIRLLLVDDHEVVRAGLRMLFMAEDDMEIVGEVGSGEEAIEAVRDLAPDVVIMDVVMPGLSGIEATRQMNNTSLRCCMQGLRAMYPSAQLRTIWFQPSARSAAATSSSILRWPNCWSRISCSDRKRSSPRPATN